MSRASYTINARRVRKASLILLALCTIYIFWTRIGPALYYTFFPHPHPALNDNLHAIQYEQNITTNLIIASTSKESTQWASSIPILNLKIIRYITDSASAQYHPTPLNKGREALMYFTYLHDFYDQLPDISIFVHAEETPWHVEGTLLRNTSFALSHLNLKQVLDDPGRGYFNLRVTWRAGCPNWIDTRKTFDNWDKSEEPYMPEAWTANFPVEEKIPDILGGPCCSQFAVSREVIRSRPKEQYRRSMEWLQTTQLNDYVVGRVWEHMWPWLFRKQARDCEYEERESLCQMYGVCFGGQRELDEYEELWEVRERVKEDMEFHRAVWRPGRAREARMEMERISGEIERIMREVLSRDERTIGSDFHGPLG